MKLEEEYTHMSKNHEEEIELRMKFETKLNQLSTEHKELSIKFDRTSHNATKLKELLRLANKRIGK